PIEELGDVAERVEIAGYLTTSVGTLHLDGHASAVAQHGAMHLTERCRGERRRLERLEAFRDAESELLFDDRLDVGERERLDLVLKAGQRLEVGRRKQIGTRREQLAELDVRGAQTLEVPGQFFGCGMPI